MSGRRRVQAHEPVLVIGAGLSGLAAASTLARRGFTKVKVLEARNRLGGRIFTDRSLGAPFDMGAAWVHYAKDSTNPLLGLVESVGLRPAKTNWGEIAVYDAESGRVSSSTLKSGQDRFQAALADAAGKIRRLADKHTSLANILDPALQGRFDGREATRLLQFLRGYYVENEYAADAIDIGAYAFESTESDPEDDRLVGGYDRLIESLARGLDIALAEVVTRVRLEADGVTVDTSRGSHRAAAVIVTLPVGVLRAGGVEFSPSLPDAKRRAIRDIGVGDFEKVVLHFDRAFWPTDTHGLGFAAEATQASEVSPVLFNAAAVDGTPAIVAMLTGSAARAAAQLTDESLAARTVAQLRTMFGRETPAPRAVLRTRWHDDPFARGAYSFPGLADLGDAIRDLAAPVGGRIFFAGEATDKEWYSFAHGAYNSGVRVAKSL